MSEQTKREAEIRERNTGRMPNLSIRFLTDLIDSLRAQLAAVQEKMASCEKRAEQVEAALAALLRHRVEQKREGDRG